MKKISLILSCVLISLFALRQIDCLDIWLHLKTGQWIWDNLAVPRTQLFSFWLGDRQWIDHEWLFQAAIYPIYRFFGINGIVIFVFAMISVLLLLISAAANRTDRFFGISILSVILSTVVASSRFIPRPEIFSLIFFGCFIILLKGYKGGNDIYLLLPLQILWVNIHGYFLLGPLVVLIFLISKIIEARMPLPFLWNENAISKNTLNKIMIVLSLLMASFLISPYLLKGALYPIWVLKENLLEPEGRRVFEIITELKRIPLHDIVADDKGFFLHTAILVFFFAALLNLKRLDIFDLLVFGVFFGLTLSANRHVSIFAMSLCLLTIFNLISAEKEPFFFFICKKRYTTKVLSALGGVFSLIIFLYVASYFHYFVKARYIYNAAGENKSYFFGKDEANLNFTEGAARFIRENNIKGNVYNFFNNGNFLIFHLYPQCQVFIDGRTEVYGSRLLKMSELIFSKPETTDALSKKLNFNCIALPCYTHPDIVGMFKYLYRHKDWKLVFFDCQSYVFLKNIPEYKRLIRQNTIDLEGFHVKPNRDLIVEAIKNRYQPLAYINAAVFFNEVDMPTKALEQIEIIEEISPRYNIHNIKGVALAKLSRKKEAYDEFSKALKKNPQDPSIYKNLGVLYLRSGKPDIARQYFKAGLKISPNDKKLKACLAKLD